jgi:hypothetical protein
VSSFRVAGIFAGWFAAVAGAVEPTLTHLFPVAGTAGTTVSVTAGGSSEPWPPQVWVDAPGIAFQAGKTKGKFDVEIAQDAAPGAHLVRFFNEQGVSAPRFFIVSSEPEVLDAESNNDFKWPQKIDRLPTTISGRLDKAGDVDSFAVTLQKGQTLTAAVEAYVLASTFDGLLRIVDSEGTQLAFNDDGRTLDPLLTWAAPRDGTFIVQLMGFVYPASSGVAMTGGEGCVYRLHLSTAPATRRITLPPHKAAQGMESHEQEPNDAAAMAGTIIIPGAVTGGIQTAGDEDRFAFTAVQQRSYEFKVIAARAGSPLDAWLKIENAEGKELARNDDAAGSRDPQLPWKAPSDGTFFVVVGDLTHRGGDDFLYCLIVSEAAPSVRATAVNHSTVVQPGKTGELKVAVKRANGYKRKLQLAARNLPEGLSAPEVEVPDKDGEVTLKITADSGTKAASQPFQLVLREVEAGTEHPVIYWMISTGENNGVPQGYTELVIDSTDQLWLTLQSAAKSEPPKAASPSAP